MNTGEEYLWSSFEFNSNRFTFSVGERFVGDRLTMSMHPNWPEITNGASSTAKFSDYVSKYNRNDAKVANKFFSFHRILHFLSNRE